MKSFPLSEETVLIYENVGSYQPISYIRPLCSFLKATCSRFIGLFVSPTLVDYTVKLSRQDVHINEYCVASTSEVAILV